MAIVINSNPTATSASVTFRRRTMPSEEPGKAFRVIELAEDDAGGLAVATN